MACLLLPSPPSPCLLGQAWEDSLLDSLYSFPSSPLSTQRLDSRLNTQPACVFTSASALQDPQVQDTKVRYKVKIPQNKFLLICMFKIHLSLPSTAVNSQRAVHEEHQDTVGVTKPSAQPRASLHLGPGQQPCCRVDLRALRVPCGSGPTSHTRAVPGNWAGQKVVCHTQLFTDSIYTIRLLAKMVAQKTVSVALSRSHVNTRRALKIQGLLTCSFPAKVKQGGPLHPVSALIQ